VSIFRPFSAGRDWVGRKSPDRRLHAARVLILTRLCAGIPWPIQILAPSVLSMRVRSQPHPRLRVLILPSTPLRHLIVRRNAGRCSSARRPAEGCPCGGSGRCTPRGRGSDPPESASGSAERARCRVGPGPFGRGPMTRRPVHRSSDTVLGVGASSSFQIPRICQHGRPALTTACWGHRPSASKPGLKD